MKNISKHGRFEDDHVAHVATGEMVLPRDVVASESGKLSAILTGHGYDPSRYVVGGENSINPETGLPEFFGFKSFFRKILPIAAAIAPVALPGIGTLGSAALGAAAGGLSGGGLKGALLGGISGGLAGGGSSALAGMTGLSGAPASALSGALTGAATGLASGGGLKGALLGGALGGAGGYAFGGGIPSLGTAAGTPLAGGVGPTQGSGIIGEITRGASSVGSNLGSLSNLQTPLTLMSGLNSYMTQGDVEKQLKDAQQKAAGVLSPYESTGAMANAKLSQALSSGALGGAFAPGDLTQDPGYQFRLQEGQKALERSQAASGGLASGAALKAAQQYGQGLADQTYNDAYQRWLQGQQNTYGMLSGTAGKGMLAAGAMGDIYGNIGNIGANADVAKSNVLTGTLASALRGSPVTGFDTAGNVQGSGLTPGQLKWLQLMGAL